MDQSQKVINIKTEPTEPSSTDRLEFSTEMQLNSVKQESVCLVRSKIYIKTEHKEEENEFPVLAGTNKVYPNYDMQIKTEEQLIKNKCALDVGSEMKDKKHFPIYLDHSESRIKTEPIIGKNEAICLETDKDDSQGCSSNHGQEQLFIKNDPDCKDKKYVCHECNKAFTHKCSLDRHLRIHTGEKPFQCNVCEKLFNEKSNLDRHMRIHSNAKTHACDMCKKVFSEKSNLMRHKLIHSGVKAFSCDECNKLFTHRCSLVNHQRIHTGAKPFICDICTKAFAVKSHLNEHRHTHTGEKPYSCVICNRSFAHKSTLIGHKKTHKT